MSEIRATKRDPITGTAADMLSAVDAWMRDSRRTQQMQGMADVLGLSPYATTLDRVSYGDPLTTGKGWTTQAKPETADVALGLLGMLPMGRPAAMATKGMPVGMSIKDVGQTVMRPKRIAYPEIYKNPRELVAEASARVAPENPMMERLFGVTRDDLFNISEQGTRQGNMLERPFKAAEGSKGARHAPDVMNPRNTRRLQDIIGEARENAPELYKGMASWYTMDPLFDQFVRLYGKDDAVAAYNRFNTLTGMASPGSEVLTEFNRGTAANWLANEGRFQDFQKYAGMAESKRNQAFPDDMRGVIGHPYHKTAHSNPMTKYVETGLLDMDSAKVPSYIHASGVPETGYQTQWPVGDAHWSRIVGLPDVRGKTTKKGVEVLPNASASVTEMTALGPWWAEKVAKPLGIEAVPAQAVIWGAGSGATGVTSPIGAPKLELLAQQIEKAAARMGVPPETARDLILRGQGHAGFIDPALAATMGAAAGGGLAANYFLRDE